MTVPGVRIVTVLNGVVTGGSGTVKDDEARTIRPSAPSPRCPVVGLSGGQFDAVGQRERGVRADIDAIHQPIGIRVARHGPLQVRREQARALREDTDENLAGDILPPAHVPVELVVVLVGVQFQEAVLCGQAAGETAGGDRRVIRVADLEDVDAAMVIDVVEVIVGLDVNEEIGVRA